MSQRMLLAALSLSAAGLVGVVVHEGYSDSAIIPVPGDVPTIGFGTTRRADGSPVQIGDKTTPPQALARALRDVQVKEAALKRCIKAPLYQHEYDALVSLVYNVGADAVCSSSIPRRIEAGDYSGACRTILDFDGFRDRSKSMALNPKTGRMEYPLVRLAGLTKRRQAEYRQCLGDGA